jgi:DNA-directed RNA polymerase specialized sigma24 family protein
VNTDEFEDRLKALRPRLHRYCARMTGSAVDGEDIVQDAMTKAFTALPEVGEVTNPEGWVFRMPTIRRSISCAAALADQRYRTRRFST